MNHLQRELAQREICKRDILPFILRFHKGYKVGWFHKLLCEKINKFIQDVEEGREPRLILSVPPRHGKSTVVSEMLPPFVIGKHPEWDFIYATYNQTFAEQFGRKVRDRLNDSRYLDLFNLSLDGSSNASDLVKTSKGGMYKATGVGGSLTGMGANVLVIDDPIKDRADADSIVIRENLWDWYTSVARTRLHPGGGIVVVHTRWNVDDLIGRLMKQMREAPDSDQWEIIEFPAIAAKDDAYRNAGEALHPERYNVQTLLRIKASIPPRDWSALYQSSPYVESGNFFHKDTIKYYDKLPDNLNFIIAGDYSTSSKKFSDHTCIIPAGVNTDRDIYIHPDFIYERLEPLAAVARTVALAKRVRAHILVHEKGVIANTIEPLFKMEMQRQSHYLVAEKYTRTASKHVHALAFKGMMEAGKVYFPSSKRTLIEPLLLKFAPNVDGEDDLIDALASIGINMSKAIGAPSRYKPEKPEVAKTQHERLSEMVRHGVDKLKQPDSVSLLDDW